MKEVYSLLSENYVEDYESQFRFAYSRDFLEWALKAPDWRKEWHLGIRNTVSARLVAFISAIPMCVFIKESHRGHSAGDSGMADKSKEGLASGAEDELQNSTCIRGSGVKKVVQVNFLCVDKQLRRKSMAPMLIKELTRRVHIHGDIYQALYTAGTRLPTPVSTCRQENTRHRAKYTEYTCA